LELLCPAPQEQSSKANPNGSTRRYFIADHRRIPEPGSMTTPMTATAQNQGAGVDRLGARAAMVREVVVTVTLTDDADVALTVKLAGDIEQLVPVGTPVQVREVSPLIPAPPMLSV
jgi:hypothetical protein